MKYNRNSVLQVLFLLKWLDGKVALIFVGATWASERKVAAGRCLFLTYPCPMVSSLGVPWEQMGYSSYTSLSPYHILLYAIHDINLCYGHKREVNLQCIKLLPFISWVSEAGSATAFRIQMSLGLLWTNGSSCMNWSLATERLSICTSGGLPHF